MLRPCRREREHLRSVSGTLEAQVEAMLADGVGAALAAVNELEYRADGGAGGTQSSDTLSHMLTGGPYVRSLFLANSQRFVRVGRTSAPDTEAVPPGLAAAAYRAASRTMPGWARPCPIPRTRPSASFRLRGASATASCATPGPAR